VIDLNDYLNKPVTQVLPRSRVLVVDYKGVYAGLVVDDVTGLRHFSEDEMLQEQAEVDAAFQPYITHAYVRGGNRWDVFSMYALAESARFLQAAV
jgi:twitching motility protein PilI